MRHGKVAATTDRWRPAACLYVLGCLLLAGLCSCHASEPSGEQPVTPAGPMSGAAGARESASDQLPLSAVSRQRTPTLMAAAQATGTAAADSGDCIVVADGNPDYGPPPLEVFFTAEAECSAG